MRHTPGPPPHTQHASTPAGSLIESPRQTTHSTVARCQELDRPVGHRQACKPMKASKGRRTCPWAWRPQGASTTARRTDKVKNHTQMDTHSLDTTTHTHIHVQPCYQHGRPHLSRHFAHSSQALGTQHNLLPHVHSQDTASEEALTTAIQSSVQGTRGQKGCSHSTVNRLAQCAQKAPPVLLWTPGLGGAQGPDRGDDRQSTEHRSCPADAWAGCWLAPRRHTCAHERY